MDLGPHHRGRRRHLGLVAGQQYNILANLNSFPRIPINEGELNTMSIIAASWWPRWLWWAPSWAALAGMTSTARWTAPASARRGRDTVEER